MAVKEGLIALLALGVAASANAVRASAQEAGGARLHGTVADATGAVVPEVHVTLTGDVLGTAQHTATAADGAYSFTGLAPGEYQLTFEGRGFARLARGPVRVGRDSVMRLDIRLDIAPLQDEAVVTGRTPVVGTTITQSPVALDADLLFHLPTSRRHPDTINLIPGVAEHVAFGGTQDSNALLVDGVPIGDTKMGSQALTVSFNYNWVDEVRPIALGANAEHGEFTGIAVNSVIRSGTNRFHGLGERWMTDSRWMWSNTSALPAEREYQFRFTQPSLFRDTSVQLGGPIAVDRLWFFAGIQAVDRQERLTTIAHPVNRQRDRRAIVKLTSRLSPDLTLEGFHQRDWSRTDAAIIGAVGPSDTLAAQRSPGTTWNAQMRWQAGRRTTLDVRHTGFDSLYSLDPMPPQTTTQPWPRLDLVTGLASGNAPYYVRYQGRPRSIGATVTRLFDRFGLHQSKLGVEHHQTTALDQFGHPGGRWYLDLDGEPYLVILFDGSADRPTSRRTTVFAQDGWTASDRVTFHVGVRVGANRGSVPGRGTVFVTNPVAARVGAAWNVPGDDTIVRVHYGRYHDALLSGQFQFMDSEGQRHPYITAAVLPTGRFAELDRFDGSSGFAIDDEIEHSYVDQWVVGIERELPGRTLLLAQFIRRDFRNVMAFVDTGSVYAPVLARDPGADGRIGTPDDGDVFTVFNKTNPGQEFRLFTNPVDAFRRYQAVQLVGRRRYADGWQVLAAYTWSRTEGTVDQRLGTNAGHHDAGHTGAFVNPNRMIHASGRTSFDFTHEVKAEGTYRIPAWGGFNVSAVYRYRTGLAWGRLANVLWLWQGTERVRIEPRGTRRLPALNGVDVRIEKTFPATWRRANVGVFVDVFNATNQGIPNSRYPFAVVSLSGPNFGEPGTWIDPRTIRGGARVTF